MIQQKLAPYYCVKRQYGVIETAETKGRSGYKFSIHQLFDLGCVVNFFEPWFSHLQTEDDNTYLIGH